VRVVSSIEESIGDAGNGSTMAGDHAILKLLTAPYLPIGTCHSVRVIVLAPARCTGHSAQVPTGLRNAG
jgi:hypothetical protein